MEEDDDEEEEDYLKPDSDCSPTSTGEAKRISFCYYNKKGMKSVFSLGFASNLQFIVVFVSG